MYSDNCEKCGSEKKYSQKYDAFYCESCDIWLEKLCADWDCEFCANRPEKPSLVRNHNEESLGEED